MPALAGTNGIVTFADTTVVAPNVYSYRVKAMNGTVSSAYSNVAPNIAAPGVPTVPVAPTGFTAAIALPAW